MQPIRAITLRFTGTVSHGVIVGMMNRLPFAFCASLGFRRCRYPNLSEENQPWFYSADLRQGFYEGVDHASLLPLDEEIITAMRDCEALFMYMMIRLEYARNVPYLERKQRYLMHLRFWNDFLQRNKINLLLSSTLPHEMPDHVIHALCKLKGIPVVFCHATLIKDTGFIHEDIEESTVDIGKRYAEICKQGELEVTLCPQFEEYYEEQTQPEGKTPVIFPDQPRSIIRRFAQRVLSKPDVALRWIWTLFCVANWSRRWQKVLNARMQEHLRQYYDRHAVEPDYEKTYIYFPLQYQPECSTCPMAGAFVDQTISTHLMSQTVPDGVLIYIKEHPRQRKEGIVGRNLAFFQELANMPNVRFVKHDADTFKLRESCAAVATGTGTAGMEALFRGKPVLLFGHTYYQYAPCVFQIRTTQDCKEAMQSIFERHEKPDMLGVRRFLKAMEDTRVHGSLTEWYTESLTDLNDEQSTAAFTDAFTKKVQEVLQRK